MRLKKITALFLTGALILSMAGCAGNGSKDKKEGSAGNEAQEPVKIATKPMTEPNKIIATKSIKISL